jgi:hypothetical protein
VAAGFAPLRHNGSSVGLLLTGEVSQASNNPLWRQRKLVHARAFSKAAGGVNVHAALLLLLQLESETDDVSTVSVRIKAILHCFLGSFPVVPQPMITILND